MKLSGRWFSVCVWRGGGGGCNNFIFRGGGGESVETKIVVLAGDFG